MQIDQERALIWSKDGERSARYSIMDGMADLFESNLTLVEEGQADQLLQMMINEHD